MSVARVEPEGDASTGLLEHYILTPDRPRAGEGPVVGAQALRKLERAGCVGSAPSGDAKRSPRP